MPGDGSRVNGAATQLRVLDWDEPPELMTLPELAGKVHGWGEAFYVSDGSITHFHTLGCKGSLHHQ